MFWFGGKTLWFESNFAIEFVQKKQSITTWCPQCDDVISPWHHNVRDIPRGAVALTPTPRELPSSPCQHNDTTWQSYLILWCQLLQKQHYFKKPWTANQTSSRQSEALLSKTPTWSHSLPKNGAMDSTIPMGGMLDVFREGSGKKEGEKNGMVHYRLKTEVLGQWFINVRTNVLPTGTYLGPMVGRAMWTSQCSRSNFRAAKSGQGLEGITLGSDIFRSDRLSPLLCSFFITKCYSGQSHKELLICTSVLRTGFIIFLKGLEKACVVSICVHVPPSCHVGLSEDPYDVK